MKCFIVLLVAQLSMAQPLTAHYFKDRVVTIHADSSQIVLFERQQSELLIAAKEMKERRLVMYSCIASKCLFNNFSEAPVTTEITPTEKTFEIRLYGLDGQIKFEANEYTSPQVMFSLIDKMPMRRNEMRKRIKKEGYD